MNITVWLSNEGRAYFVQNNSSLSQRRRSSVQDSNGSSNPISPTKSTSSHIPTPTMPTFEKKIHWTGVCFHNSQTDENNIEHRATSVAINSKFSLIAIGTNKGIVYIYSANSYTATPTLSHKLELTSWSSQSSYSTSEENSVESLEWTSDGYALAVAYKKHGLSVWSVYGGLLCATSEMDDVFGDESGYRLKDFYVKGIQTLVSQKLFHIFLLIEIVLGTRKSSIIRVVHSDR